MDEYEGFTAEELFQWLFEATELLHKCEEAISKDLLTSVERNWAKNHALYLDIKKFNDNVWEKQ
jgi:hypothetical protein